MALLTTAAAYHEDATNTKTSDRTRDTRTGSLFSAPIYSTYGNILIEQRFDPPGFQLPLGMKDTL
jgi:hypothetical protein